MCVCAAECVHMWLEEGESVDSCVLACLFISCNLLAVSGTFLNYLDLH